MGKKRFISKEIEDFYNEVSEESRLTGGLGPLEFKRNKELIEKFIPSPNSTVLDVGGGTGRYAEWLANKGHNVSLVEPIEKHVKLAQKRAKKSNKKFTVHLAEARNLDFIDNFADVVILHGPLYHLQDPSDRKKAIAEAKRVLKKDGILLGFAINYTASMFVGLLQGLIHDESFFNMCKEELTTGIHRPADNIPGLLVEAYHHRPEELKEEILAVGLEYIDTFAIEGVAWLDKNYFVNISDKKKEETLFELIRMTENDPNLLSFSPHMMIATKKSR